MVGLTTVELVVTFNDNPRTSAPLVKVNSTYMKHKSDRVNRVAPAYSPVDCLLCQCLYGTVQTGSGKVDPARKFKCTTAVREPLFWNWFKLNKQHLKKQARPFTSSMKVPIVVYNLCH